MEDKIKITQKLEELLKETRFARNELSHLEYFKDDINELIIVHWKNGTTEKINVAMDSGIAMIIDVAKWLNTK